MSDLLIVSDIGSTTTKVLLLEVSAGRLALVDSADEPTTVESPHADVRVGLFRAVDRIARKTGHPLRDDDRFLVPYFTTSSAGGGLQILVVALASWDTGVMARAVTCGAGGVVLDSFTIDDETPRVEKIKRMSMLSPDLVVMAGGYEDGAVAAVVNMAQLLALSAPRPKYGRGKLPLVFCGNTGAREYVKEILGDGFEIHFAENIRPSGMGLNLRPAIEAVHKLFMDHVMQMAPGYQSVAAAASVPVIPTPSGVERILSLHGQGKGEGIFLVDIGGATTDVFSLAGGRVQRTVSANLGMSYSLSNLLREAGSEMVFRHLPGLPEAVMRDRILEKTLFPTITPDDEFGALVEHACAAEGVRLAFGQHMEFSYRRERVGFLDRLKLLTGCKFDAKFRTVDRLTSFRLSDFNTLIGAGGVLSHADPLRAAWILTQGFSPRGVTTLIVDARFHSPHMGVLSTVHPGMALDYYRENCLRTVCRVVTPMHAVKKGRPAMTVTGPDGPVTVMGGDFLYIRDGKGFKAGDWEETEGIPLLADCRAESTDALPVDFQKAPIRVSVKPASHSRSVVSSEPGKMEHTFTLPYPGEILVKPGDRVEPGTLLGQNRLSPPMVYFIDVRGQAGYTKNLSTAEVLSRVTVRPGDEVAPGTVVFRHSVGSGISRAVHEVKSPVRGLVTRVSPPGLICLREIQDYDGKPHVVDVAAPLGVKPKHFGRFLKVRRGEFVLRGQALAVGERLVTVKSPSAGTVTEVDKTDGTVTVQYVTNPVRLESPLHGTVSGVVPEHSLTVSFRGVRTEGVLGLGKDASGALSTVPGKGVLLLCETSLTSEDIVRAEGAGAAALICPGVPGEVVSGYLGCDPGVILTGGEDLPVSILAVSGVGSTGFASEEWRKLSAMSGNHGAVFTTTRIRAGVERPWFLSEQE
ncbi:MAG: glutamate mutase L [Candidatus Fermentibacteraceae bacterium]